QYQTNSIRRNYT
ncbi:unnamed protein product, partial [Rotaria magnacalcarata]